MAVAMVLLGGHGTALAGPPAHLQVTPPPIEGLDHACGVAVDSEGDVYVSSAGDGEIKVFAPDYQELLAIPSPTNEPCGLAVDPEGNLYASELGTGNVVRYSPAAYPFGGTPNYGAPATVDSSGKAMGIAVDSVDGRLYVAEGTRIGVYKFDDSLEGLLGEGDVTEATGVAAYTYVYVKNNLEEGGTRHLYVADDSDDTVKLFSGDDGAELPKLKTSAIAAPSLRRTLTGPREGEDFGFGSEGAYLAIDPGNADAAGKCAQVGKQACTWGHLLVYDQAHAAVDEFDAAGEFLDQIASSPALADAKPTAMAIDRSGGGDDGRVYVSVGAGSGAKVLAFTPLFAPRRRPLGQPPQLGPPSQVVPLAAAAATDTHGYVYVAASKEVRVYDSSGAEVTKFTDGESPFDLAVDSEGQVYVVDTGPGVGKEKKVTYYTPSAYPPTEATSYSRHEPPIATTADWPSFCKNPAALAVNLANDHLFVTTGCAAREYGSAQEGSPLLDPDFGVSTGPRTGLGVCGGSGEVYFASNESGSGGITIVESGGDEAVARITGAGSPAGLLPQNPEVAVDQSNCHVLAHDPSGGAAREYDARGAFVAEFGGFANTSVFDIAIDSACATHRDGTGKPQPLDATTTPSCDEYDPADGHAYVVNDQTTEGTPDLWAFDRLSYGERPLAFIDVPSGLGSGGATLEGSVNPQTFELEECRFDYLADAQYQQNLEDEEPAFEGALSQACAETPEGIGSGEDQVPVHADVTGLNPDGRYRCRLVATNEFGPAESTACLFGPPLVAARPPTVLYDEATLRAAVEPAGLATAYHFEYGPPEGAAGEYTHSTPAAQLLPQGESFVDVQAALFGLEEGATYHFRIVAENEAGTEQGSDRSLTTRERRAGESCANALYRTGPSANLPDCRAYELVTPARAGGLSPGANQGGSVFNNPLTVPRGSSAGERLSFFTKGTLEGFDGNGKLDGYRADRGPGAHPLDGWTTQATGPNFTQAAGVVSSMLGLAADQLYSSWSIGKNEAGFPDALPPGQNLRTDGGADGSPCNLLPLQDDFEVVGCGDLGSDVNAQVRHLAPGGAHVVFSSKAHLEPAAPPSGTEAIYDREAGSSEAEVVSTKPNGAPFGEQENVTYVGSDEAGATALFKQSEAQRIQLDATGGSFKLSFKGEETDSIPYNATANVVQETLDDLDSINSGAGSGVNVTQGPTGETGPNLEPYVVIFIGTLADKNVPELGCVGSLTGGASTCSVETEAGAGLYAHRDGQTTEIAEAPFTYAGISEGGTRVFFVDETSALETPPAGLFACDVEAGSCAGPEKSQDPVQIAEESIFVNVSPDGSHAFFSSGAVLTGTEENENGEMAEGGERNLYAWDGTTVRFVAILDERDFEAFGVLTDVDLNQWIEAATEEKEGGRASSPTRSTADGVLVFQSHAKLTPYDNEGMGEVYRYDPAAPSGGTLICVSCDPTGAPPSAEATLQDGRSASPVRQRSIVIANLTDAGTAVFFNSYDRLVPEDANAAQDVYEWAAMGTGEPECTQPRGCLALVSSGQGEGDNYLVSMSADGHDVFFWTEEKLVGVDVVGSKSIYDARVEGGIPEPEQTETCQADDCQPAGSDPPSLPTAATSGAGSAAAESPKRRCAKGKHRVKGRCVARHKRHKGRHKRTGHRQGARR